MSKAKDIAKTTGVNTGDAGLDVNNSYYLGGGGTSNTTGSENIATGYQALSSIIF